MHMRNTVTLVFVLLYLMPAVLGQAELRKISPLSPEAAAFAKYGEIPVGNFSGIPGITIPIYSIKSRQLQLPIALSYHAGGNKVEDIASWVGLGWSLGSIPSISRSVRGLEDEGANGYFYLYGGKTVRQIYNESGSNYTTFLTEVRNGNADAEPDIFSYSLPGKNGKFYFNQETGQFHTTPYDNIQITKLTTGFRIVSDDGTIYDFGQPEAGTNNLQPFTNSWWSTKIVNADRTDTISFSYETEFELYSNFSSVSKNIFISGSTECLFPSYEANNVVTVMEAVKPSQINFSGGYIRFIRQNSEREDLSGGRALARIEVYDYNNTLIRTFNFTYSYLGSPSGSYDEKRLLLDAVSESGPDGYSLPPHKFFYETAISAPSRMSSAQDYWGYYNGATANADLIPSIFYTTGGTPSRRILVGANRSIDTVNNQFGILKQIDFPTGGSSSFEYESNWVNEPGLPIISKDVTVALLGNGAPSNYALYEKFFEVNVPADPDLNDNMGGAFVNVSIGNLGCDISSGANLCASLSITGQSPNNSSIGLSIISNVNGLYLPNGTYKMQAEFNQDPALFGNFFFSIQWKKADSNYVDRRLAGGLRVKKITTYDGINPTKNIIKKFYYSADPQSNSSSGRVLGVPFFNFQENFLYTKYQNVLQGCASCEVLLLKRSSASNITSVSQSGSFVGYEYLTVYSGENGEAGKTTYQYSLEPDQVSNVFPYPPAKSHEEKRGLLLESTDYRQSAGNFFPVRKTTNSYARFLSATKFNNSVAFALKIASKDIIVDECHTFPFQPQIFSAVYDIQTDQMLLSTSTERTYSSTDPAQYATQLSVYDYDADYTQLRSVKTYRSNGDSLIVYTKYPYDLTLSGTAETARAALLSQNRISSVLQNIKTVNNIQTELSQTDYNNWSGTLIAAGNLQYQYRADPKEIRISFNSYDAYGNLLEQQKVNDVKHSYIWDYFGNYVVAETVNADAGEIAYTSFEADGTGNWSIPSSLRFSSAMTGARAYQLSNGNISKTGLNSSIVYIVSYWSTSGQYSVSGTVGSPIQGKTKTISGVNWTYFEHKISGVTTTSVSGTGNIDELRLYPERARMTTFAYKPLIGLMNQCDAANRVAYYEYDGVGRLKTIRDDNGYIVKHWEYKYAAPIPGSSCGTNCYVLPMLTLAGNNTIGYPVGVFNVDGKLLGNALGQTSFVTLWNGDAVNQARGILAAGSDPLYFNLTLNTGATVPSGVTGCRYYQLDLPYTQIDAIRRSNAVYIDFGDGTSMPLGKSNNDNTGVVLAPSTTDVVLGGNHYYIHNYADNSTKTLTFYHNDAAEDVILDNASAAAPGIKQVRNLRGNYPQNSAMIGGGCFQQASALTVANLNNWNSINSIKAFLIHNGEYPNNIQSPATNLNYTQDFMANNRGLESIQTATYGPDRSGYRDLGFKISRLKSDWNTYFTQLQELRINDDHWNRENLSALHHLRDFVLSATRENHLDDVNSPYIPIPSSYIDEVINQIATGSGPYVSNGFMHIISGGPNRTSASDASVNLLKSKGWAIYVNGVLQ
jgi:hypothetical protein